MCHCGDRKPAPVPPDLRGRIYADPLAAACRFRDILPLLPATKPIVVGCICDIIRQVAENKFHGPKYQSATELIGD